MQKKCWRKSRRRLGFLYKYPMRKWINILTESDNLPAVVKPMPMMTLQGAHREDMSLEEAKQYLDSYPDGTLHHEGFETDSFVTKNEIGEYVFYHSVRQKLMTWDWEEDIKEFDAEGQFNIFAGWWYAPGVEMNEWYIPGAGPGAGKDWWYSIQSGSIRPE